MKKTILYAFAFALVAMMASCKCHTCERDNFPDSKLCKDDFNTTNDYNDAVELAESLGYKCKPSN